MIYFFEFKKTNLIWKISIIILRIILPFFSYFFFGQVFSFLTSVFYCRKEVSYESPYLHCLEGLWIYSLTPASIIAMVFQVIIGFITNSLYYKPVFDNNSPDFLTKTDSFPDNIFMFTKVIIILLFISDKGLESEHYPMLSFLTLVTGINAYFTLTYQNRKNKLLMDINTIFCLILFLGFATLLFGKIFKFLKFDGLIYLFVIEILVIVLFVFYSQQKQLYFLNINYQNINNSDEYLKYILKIYMIIKNYNSKRNSSILVKTFVSKVEEECYNLDCPLKKYIEDLSEGIESNFYLYLYCDKLFQYGISKFRDSIYLKVYYCTFLIDEMNNKNKAFIIMNTIQNKLISFLINYNIYRCQKLINNYSIKEKNENFFFLKYRDNLHNFNDLITKIILLHYEFLSLSLGYKIQKDDNYNKVYKISTKIKKLNTKIDNIYNELINTKVNNIEFIDLYSEYVQKILEDEEKYQKCIKNKRIFSNNSNFSKFYENNYFNFDNAFLNEKDFNPYLIISADLKDIGIIKDCSSSSSKIFGYQKEELIDQNINILIPEIFHKKHDSIIVKHSKNNIFKYFEDLSNNKIFSSNHLEKEIYAISKSKFLIPLKVNIFFTKTEENEFIYVLEINENIMINYDSNDFNCCVLTNDNLLIQSFTSNCLKYLKLNYNDINSNYDIVKNIRQFQDDYLIDINTLQLCQNSSLRESSIITHKKMEKTLIESPTISKSIKESILKKNFSKKSNITWLFEDGNHFGFNHFKLGKISKSSKEIKRKSYTSKKLNIMEDKDEKELSMEIKKIIIDNQIIGYYFFFSEPSSNKQIKTTIKHSSKDIMSKNSDFYKNIKKESSKAIHNRILNVQNVFTQKNDFKEKNTIEKSNQKVKFKNENEGKREQSFINNKFIPNSTSNFIFDLNKFSYTFSNVIENNKLIEKLREEALTKIKNSEFNKRESLDKIKSDVSQSEEYQSSYYSSEFESSSVNPISNKESSAVKKTEKPSIFKEQSNIQNNNNGLLFGVEKKKNNFMNSYYKINNIKNIHFLIFDYFKEIFVEGKMEDKISQMEKIFSELINKEKANNEERTKEIIPVKNDKIKTIQKKEENIINKNNLINDEKLLKKKIIVELRKQKDELPIKYLKIVSFLYYIIMIILLFICIFYYLCSYSNLIELLNLVKNIVLIKYCDRMSVFYVGESTLLNFNADKIKGGIFFNYPASPDNKEGYIALMREKISESYLESKKSLKEIFSSKLKLSKNTTNFLKEISLNTDFIMNNGNIEIISGDIFTTLMHYNGAFYNLATSPYYLEQNHTDILNFLHNSFNDFARGINLLISIYCYELEQQSKKIQFIWILLFIIFFIIYILIYLLVIYFYISANTKRQNYVKILYNIDEISFMKLISNCENLFRKIKKTEIKTLNDDEEENIDNDFEEEKNFLPNQNKSRKNTTIAPESNISFGKCKSKKKLPDYIIGFMKNFGIILLISYSYYIINGISFINIGKEAILISQYFFRSQNFYSYIIDIFIAYRQYVFDDSIKIYNMLPFDYLEKTEKDSYKTLSGDIQFMQSFIQQFLLENKEVNNLLNQSYCSYNFTDKFISYEDCENKLGHIKNYDFTIISSSFIEELRINKFLVKYLLSSGTVKGGLNDYNQNIWLKDPSIPKVGDNDTSENIFRLDLYNNETTHAHLDLIFVNIILPYINIHRKYILPNLSISNKTLYLYLTSFFYILFITFIYFVYLLLKIRFINDHIYKTKNMLTLIPTNILASTNNIKQLLDI